MCYSTEAACHVVGPALLLGRARIQDVGGHHPERPTFDSHVRPSLRPCKHAVKKFLQKRKAIFFHAKSYGLVTQRTSRKLRVTSQMEYVKSCLGYTMLSDAFCCHFGIPKVNRRLRISLLHTYGKRNGTQLIYYSSTLQ